MFYVVVNVSQAPQPARRNELDGPGGSFQLDRKEAVTTVYMREDHAYTTAEKLAMENPGKQFAVMKMETLFETAKPTLLKKVVDGQGQLVLEK